MSRNKRTAELRLECHRLGLGATGSRAELEQRLLQQASSPSGRPHKRERDPDVDAEAGAHALSTDMVCLIAEHCLALPQATAADATSLLLLSKDVHRRLVGSAAFWERLYFDVLLQGGRASFFEKGNDGGQFDGYRVWIGSDGALCAASEDCDEDEQERSQATVQDLRDLCRAFGCGQKLSSAFLAHPFAGNEAWTHSPLGYYDTSPFALLGSSVRAAFGAFEQFQKGADDLPFFEEKDLAAFAKRLGDQGEDDDGDDDDGGGGGGDGNKHDAAVSLVSCLQGLFPSTPIRYAEGNQHNCDALLDALYVKRGNAVGGLLIYKLW